MFQKNVLLTMLLVGICYTFFFYSNTAFCIELPKNIDWEQWRIRRDSPDTKRPAQRQAIDYHKKALKKAYNLNKKGNQAYRAGNWDVAENFYKNALKYSPYDKLIRQNLKNAAKASAKASADDYSSQRNTERQQRQLEEAQKKKRDRIEFEQGKKEMLTQLKGERGGKGLSLKVSGVKPGNVPAANQGAEKTGQVKTGGKDPEAKKEQFEFENFNDNWMKEQKQLIAQRLKKPNKWCSGIHASLMGKVPPLPYKKFNELEAGDVLLIGDGLKTISKIDSRFSGDKISNASHTVSYLKEVNGKKLFLDNQPGKGPSIISEDVFLEKYGSRSAEVARLVGQPASNKETKELFTAAVKMAQKNRNAGGTNYGVWGKDDLVCSEASWALLKAIGRKIPKSDDQIKVVGGIDFSPADFQNSQYFLVTPLYMPK